MTLLNRLRILKIFVQLIRDPRRTELIFEGVQIFSHNPDQTQVKVIEDMVLAQDEFRAMYEANYVPNAPPLDALKACPEGSFGAALYKHMTDNGLDFSLWPKYDSQKVVDYLSTRIYQDHDLWHALLGYGVSVEDELAVQAFGFAQFQSPIALMLISVGLIHLMMKDPKRAVDAFHRVNAVYQIGKKSRFMLSVRLHEYFSTPLNEVRQICGVA